MTFSEKRFSELDNLISQVYEDKVIGKIPETVCVKLLEKYQSEQKELSEKIAKLRTELEKQNQNENDVDEFIKKIRQYVSVETLDRAMALELIDHIEIGARDVDERQINIFYMRSYLAQTHSLIIA